MFLKLHLWLNQNYSAIKHWLAVVVGILLLVFSMITIAGQNRLLRKVDSQSSEITRLSKENKRLNVKTKELGEENQSIAKQNRSFVLCGFQVFAKFTRDYQAIKNLDLENCTTDSQSQATNNTNTSGTSSSTSSTTQNDSQASSVPSSSSSQNTTTSPPAQPNNSQPITTPLPNCKVDIFMIHIGC